MKACRTRYSEFLKERDENEIEIEKATQLEIRQSEVSEIRSERFRNKINIKKFEKV